MPLKIKLDERINHLDKHFRRKGKDYLENSKTS